MGRDHELAKKYAGMESASEKAARKAQEKAEKKARKQGDAVDASVMDIYEGVRNTPESRQRRSVATRGRAMKGWGSKNKDAWT